MFKSIDLIVFICLEILASPHTIWGRCDSRMNRTYQRECIPPLYVCMCVCVGGCENNTSPFSLDLPLWWLKTLCPWRERRI